MKKLTTDAVAEIKAAQGVYRASDVARAYDCHRSTIKRIWDGAIHVDLSPAADFPDIVAKHRPSDKADDLNILIGRGMSINEAADALGMARSTAYEIRGCFV